MMVTHISFLVFQSVRFGSGGFVNRFQSPVCRNGAGKEGDQETCG